ncbi:hypothetical protein [Thermococcus sp.]|uniref:hypothetical protein n=1 Tax=Thermococcus sp. TaxID=35749 RepID=UPI00261F891D|nr:hypothetical protein [Thermococcus sp.]
MRTKAVLLLFLMTLPLVGASAFSGYLYVPSELGLNNSTVTFEDISIANGSLLLDVNGSMEVVNLGGLAEESWLNLTYLRAFTGEKTLVYIVSSLPYVFPGDNLTLGPYRLTVLSVGEKGVEVEVSYGNESRTFTSSFKFHNLVFNMSGYGTVYDGYLKLNGSVSFAGYTITFTSASVENASSGFIERVFFRFENETIGIPVGNETRVGPFDVKVEELVGLNYTKVLVHFLGVSFNASIVPDRVFELSPNQTTPLGPYIFRYDYHLGSSVHVSLLNPCQVPVASGNIVVSNVSSSFYHGGITVIPLSLYPNGTVRFAAFINQSAVPSIGKLANVKVFLRITNATQYRVVDGTVRVLNDGNVALSNVTVVFEPSKSVRVLSSRTFFIKRLEPGGEAEFKVELMPLESGNVTLGEVRVIAAAPYELACGGYTLLKFSSGEVVSHVRPTSLAYSLSAYAPGNVSLYRPFNLTVAVRSLSSGLFPLNLTIGVPSGVAVAINGRVFASGSTVVVPLSIEPNETSTVTLTVVPYTSGEKVFDVRVSSIPGVVNETKVAVEVVPPTQEREPSPTFTSTVSTVTERINSTLTVTKSFTETHTSYRTVTSTTTTSVPYVPFKTKALWLGIGLVLGVLIIVALAWFEARSS